MNSLQSARPSLPACLKVRSRTDHQHHHHPRFPATPLPSPAGVRWQLHQLPAAPLKSNISVPTKTHYFSCKRKGNSLGHRISHQNEEEQKQKAEQDGPPKPCLCTKAFAPTVPLLPSAHPSESNPIKTCGPVLPPRCLALATADPGIDKFSDYPASESLLWLCPRMQITSHPSCSTQMLVKLVFNDSHEKKNSVE